MTKSRKNDKNHTKNKYNFDLYFLVYLNNNYLINIYVELGFVKKYRKILLNSTMMKRNFISIKINLGMLIYFRIKVMKMKLILVKKRILILNSLKNLILKSIIKFSFIIFKIEKQIWNLNVLFFI